jgi:hypothetical protein
MSTRFGLQHFVSTTEPVASALGDLWYNTSTGSLSVREAVGGTVVGWLSFLTGPTTTGTARSIPVFTNAGLSSLTNSSLVIDGGGNLSAASGTLTITNPTITNPTITNYTETVFTANTGSSITISLANGTVQVLTLTATTTITMPTAAAGKSFVIILVQDSTGGRVVTWSTVSWPAATAPTLTTTAGKKDIFSFFSDGASWYGTTIGQNYT